MTGLRQFSLNVRRLATALSLGCLIFLDSAFPAASDPEPNQPVKEYTRIHPKTGLPVRVRAYYRRVVAPKAVAVRSYFRHGRHVRGHERRRPHQQTHQTQQQIEQKTEHRRPQ